jgi:hypothetical protein
LLSLADVDQANTASNPVVDVYGDSLMAQSHGALQFQLGLDRVPTVVRYFGGTALCDWVPAIESNEQRSKPLMVVIEFSGNDLTPCMAGARTTPDIVAKYRASLIELATWSHSEGVPLAVVGAPPGIQKDGQPIETPSTWAEGRIPPGYAEGPPNLNAMYQDLVQRFQARHWQIAYIDATVGVAAPDGRWTYVLPCLSFETKAMGCNQHRLMVVRARDYVHFCPVNLASQARATSCPVWDGGAWRYAAAISSYVDAVVNERYTPLGIRP